MNRRFLLFFSLFAISYLIFALLGFAQTPTPTSRVDLANAFGTGDFDRDGRADDLTVSETQNANPVKTSLSQTVSAGQKTIFIGGASGFAQKDEVAIIQMQGTNAGVWETAYVTDTRPKGRLLLNRTLTNTYTVDASSKAQVVKIPHYRNVRVQSGGVLTVDAWDGASGGVMFLRAQNDFDVRNGGKVDISGKGFRTGGTMTSQGCGLTSTEFYCLPGQTCTSPYGSTYECVGTPSTGNGEGPNGVGGATGALGTNGWRGGKKQLNASTSSSYQLHWGDGGGGGGAGGSGGGGSLGALVSPGSEGGAGSYGTRMTTNCSPSQNASKNTGAYSSEYGTEVTATYTWYENLGRCDRNAQHTCAQFESTSHPNELISETDPESCSSSSYYTAYQYGPPGRGGLGGTGGTTNTLPSFSGSAVYLGIGGGSGGSGGTGGSGGAGGAGTGGSGGAGGAGGSGGGAIIIFAKNISVSGEILNNGANGQRGGNGGGGSYGTACCSNDGAGGGGGGGGAGGSGGRGSGGTTRLYGETVDLGVNKIMATGGNGGAGGQSGGIGGGGGSASGNHGGTFGGEGGSGGNGSQGGNGSVGAIFAAYSNSLSGTTNPPADTQIGSVTPFSGIVPTPTPTPTPTPDPAFNNLVAYWKMNEASGNTVSDSISSNNGTANGTTIASGVLGQARNFDGFDDSIEVPDSSSLEGMSRLTVSTWIKPSTVESITLENNIGYIISKTILGALIERKTTPYSISRSASTSSVDVAIGNGSTYAAVTGRTRLSTDRFYHLVMTYDGTTLKLYVNGAEDASTPANIGALTTNANKLYMGRAASAFFGGIYPFNGTIDEVGIWNRALTRAEISRLYNGGNGLSP